MADGFTQMIDDSNAFFAELARNNTKDWFAPRKDHYTLNIKKPAELFAQILSEDFSRISGTGHTPKLFRIYRDVRFSKDKTPLNAHLHILWSQTRNSPFAPAFFFGSDPSGIQLATGVPAFGGTDLTRYRGFVDAFGDALAQVMADADLTISDWGPDPLKRVPSPYPQDHPHADLLKRKGLVLRVPLDPAWRDRPDGLPGAVTDAFRRAGPFRAVLAEGLG